MKKITPTQFAGLILVTSLWISITVKAQSGFMLNGYASSYEVNSYILTPDGNNLSGAVWYNNPILLSGNFDMAFQLYFGFHEGADGIAFVLQPIGNTIGNIGEGIGYEGISPSIAVEFDTWQNNDPIYDHIAIQPNGDVNTNLDALAGPVWASAASDNIEDNKWHSARIVWDAESITLSVYFDDILRLNYTADIISNIFAGNPMVYWGFTSATGSAGNLQRLHITSLDFTELGINLSHTNVTCNGADNGTASVTSVNGGTPPYTFNGWFSGSTLISLNASISGLGPGTYSVSYTDAAGSTLTREFNITEPDLLSFTYVADNTCNANISFSASGGTPPYAYSDDGGSSFQSSYLFPAEPPGNYYLMVKDANNCFSEVITTSITIENPLIITSTVTPASSGCNGSVSLTPSGGSAPYDFWAFACAFNGFSIDPNLFAIQNGNFSIGDGFLNAGDMIGMSDAYDNAITSIEEFPGAAIDTYIGSFKFDDNAFAFFGLTGSSDNYGFSHGFHVEQGQYVYVVETNLDWAYVGVVATIIPDTWYDFKVVVTSTGADYYYKESSSEAFNFIGSSDNIVEVPTVGVGLRYLINSDDYNGINTKNWFVGGDYEPQTGGLCPGNYDYCVFDSEGCSTLASITVTEGCGSDLSVSAGPDVTTYFGIASMEQVTRTVVVTGGTPPFAYTWTMNRPLLCNQVNGSGDESFYGGTCTNNNCPATGSQTLISSCSGSETINAILLDHAEVCVTVTDVNGCIASDCFNIFASDVRCFVGNSGNQKVRMCHHTSSPSNPWVEICVDQEAVNAHLAHGDYIGPCNGSKIEMIESLEVPINTSEFHIVPNPAGNKATIEFNSASEAQYIIEMSDMTGRKIFSCRGMAIIGKNSRILNLEGIEAGIYLVALIMDDNRELKKLIKE